MKNSFRDPVTHVLKAWGFVDANEVGDLSRPEPLSFNLVPGDWRLVDDAWIAVPAALPPTLTAPDPRTPSTDYPIEQE